MDVKAAEKRTNLKEISMVSWKCTMIHIDSPYFKKYGFTRLPLSRAKVEIEYDGLSTAMVSAIRRTMIDEVLGHIMWFEIEDVSIDESHEDYAQPDLMRSRIASIPLRMGISDKILDVIRFELDVENKTSDVMTVYSSDIRPRTNVKIDGPLFNPNFEITQLRPGKSLKIKNIHIISGYGCDNACFHQVALATLSNLDLPYRDVSREDARLEDASMVQSTVADSTKHKLSFYAKAVLHNGESDIKRFYTDVIRNLIERFRSVEYEQNVIELGSSRQLVMELDHSETIAHLLHQAIFDITKNQIKYVNYAMDNTTKLIKFTITDDDPVQVLKDAIDHIISVAELIDHA
jgi:DNA-directed RNA polymerase alpha subunit